MCSSVQCDKRKTLKSNFLNNFSDPKVITTIRRNLGIKKLLYLSCRPEGPALSNFVSLGNTLVEKRHRKSVTPPFVPRYAFAVDMFPHTNHYEMGVLFERVTR